MKDIRIEEPFTKEKLRSLRAGDSVLLTGTIFTARDAAHGRMIQVLKEGGELPLPIENAIIYYVGPSPAPPGKVIGSAGPTTSYRMDTYASALLDLGQSAMVGKGPRNSEVLEAIKRNGAVYFAAIGGAGALMSKSIQRSEIIAYEDLGAEAIRRLFVSEFPVIVAVDSEGGNLYEKDFREEK